MFGPVQALLHFTDDDDVLAQTNDNRYGLGAYLHINDSIRIQRFTKELECGTVFVNGAGIVSPFMPFGGHKRRGFGREGGRAGIEEMLQSKAVFLAP
jgi:aldehyde dehydrogenase (NAD+)